MKQEKKIKWILASDQKYHSLKEAAIQSIKNFSNYQVISYSIGYQSDSLADISISIELDISRPKSKWFWKNSVCLDAIERYREDELVWIDCDVIVNQNIDKIFNKSLGKFPLFDKCLRDQYIGSYQENFKVKNQLYNERLYEELKIKRKNKHLAHACMFRFNKEHKGFFKEAMDIFNKMSDEEAEIFLPWNDESIYNLLLEKSEYDEYLDFTCYDIDSYGDESKNSFDLFQEYLWLEGPNNLGDPWGWRFIPENKESIVYFHGVKNHLFSKLILDILLHEEFVWFSTEGIHNFKNIYKKEGSTLQIADKYGWPAAVFHEIYNLNDYENFVSLPKNGVVIDLGANIGIFTRKAESLDNRVISFEANPYYYECLRRNVKTGEIYNCLISNDSTLDNDKNLWITNHFGGSTSYQSEGELVKVYSYSLNDLFETGLVNEVDFIKIDIEGSEREVLESLSDKNALKIKQYAIEWHNKIAGKIIDNVEESDIDKKLNDVCSRFLKLGFNTHVIKLGNDNALRMLYIWK